MPSVSTLPNAVPWNIIVWSTIKPLVSAHVNKLPVLDTDVIKVVTIGGVIVLLILTILATSLPVKPYWVLRYCLSVKL